MTTVRCGPPLVARARLKSLPPRGHSVVTLLCRLRMPLLLAAAAAVMLTSSRAAAVPAPREYRVAVAGNTVTVCPHSTARACPDPAGMLRQDERTGAVVELPQACMPDPEWGGGDCYVDECVPPGSYRYGYAKPFACDHRLAWTSYWDKAEVTRPLPAGCKPTNAKSSPTPTSAAPPWPEGEDSVCTHSMCLGCFQRDDPTAGLGNLSLMAAAGLAWSLRRARRKPRRGKRQVSRRASKQPLSERSSSGPPDC